MQDGNAKQQIVERVKNATNILVTVNSNPTVDELSAALGFTLMLNKMDKHATAVFSGAIPAAINFLKPDKTFEHTVDSLRDFIIALDKEKADRLRYKVEDDVVRIFITPYKTTITDKDLQFGQGDFNVELIVALGVEKREDLDKAIVAHGRILHDATVVTVNMKDEKSSIGSIDWQDANASSLCEMLMSLSEALQPGLLDEQISTALLTGIVAATARFSNQRTTPRVMTMAAQLMAAGANQQLIATQLEEKNVLPSSSKDGATYLQEGASSRVQKDDFAPAEPEPVEEPNRDGEIHVEHDTHPEAHDETEPKELRNEEVADSANDANEDDEESSYDVERELSERLNAQIATQSHSSVDQLGKQLAEEQSKHSGGADGVPELPAPQTDGTAASAPIFPEPEKKSPSIIHDSKPAWMGPQNEAPSMGSPLSATTQQALDDANREREVNQQHTLLHHGSKEDDSAPTQKDAAAQEPASTLPDFPMQFEESPLPPPAVEKQPEESRPAESSDAPKAPTLAEIEKQAHVKAKPQNQTLTEIERQAHAHAEAKVQEDPAPALAPDHDVNQARQAVDAALNGTNFDPSNNPVQSVGAQAFPPIEHDQPRVEAALSPAPPMPALPPLPDFGTLPPLPEQAPQNDSPFVDSSVTVPEPFPPAAVSPDTSSVSAQQSTSNPGQFKIPGQ